MVPLLFWKGDRAFLKLRILIMRPRCKYRIRFFPKYRKFSPDGCLDKSCIVQISPEEAEALRLKNIKNLDQTAAAKEMGVSQSTFQRVLQSAYKKVSEAIVEGKILKIKDQES